MTLPGATRFSHGEGIRSSSVDGTCYNEKAARDKVMANSGQREVRLPISLFLLLGSIIGTLAAICAYLRDIARALIG
jgi:hypothetical protein